MAYNGNTLSIPRQQSLFIKKEATAGTLVFPAAGDAILLAGNGSISQAPEYTDSPEIRNTRDVVDRLGNKLPPGTWEIPIVIRPSGTAGTAPMGDVLYECLMGQKATVALTSVTYSQVVSGKPAFSMWFSLGHTIFFGRQCTASGARVSLNNQGYVIITFSGQCSEMGWAGRTQVSGAHVQADTTVVVDDASRFTIGARIWNVTDNDNNTNAGYAVTGVDIATNTLTISPGIAPAGGWADDAEIAGYLPTASLPTSYVSKARHSGVEIADVATDVRSVDITIDDPVSYLEEISTSDFPESFVEGLRNITGTINMYLRTKDASRLYDGRNDVQRKLEFFCGVKSGGSYVAGKKCTFLMSQANVEVPQINITDPAVEIAVPFKALGSSGEDSLSIAFT